MKADGWLNDRILRGSLLSKRQEELEWNTLPGFNLYHREVLSPCDRAHLFFLGPEMDYISWPPLQLHVAACLSSGQRNVSRVTWALAQHPLPSTVLRALYLHPLTEWRGYQRLRGGWRLRMGGAHGPLWVGELAPAPRPNTSAHSEWRTVFCYVNQLRFWSRLL